MAPQGPFKLVTVNKVPARAKIIIGRVVEAVKDTYTIDYAANSESMSLLFSWHFVFAFSEGCLEKWRLTLSGKFGILQPNGNIVTRGIERERGEI
jgi:hypothetical protein